MYKEEIEREGLDAKLMERDGTYNEDFEVDKMALGKIINENHELMGVISNMDKKVVKEKRKGFLAEIEKLNEQCEANINNPMEDLINSGKEALENIRIVEEENRIRKI